ncbi:helix-turn-helix domain-containing protein [Candidatus Shapirobacteria bacterium]|nr:helix-turn-helix domain-containing protein [Candidatus Shapirobacteria bacterium]
MKTVGQILKEQRLIRQISLTEVAEATKIRQEYLEALENDDFNRVGQPAWAKGFIKNYAEYLGLDSGAILAFFRRDFGSSGQPKPVVESLARPSSRLKLSWDPRKTALAAIILFILLFLAYLSWHLFALRE